MSQQYELPSLFCHRTAGGPRNRNRKIGFGLSNDTFHSRNLFWCTPMNRAHKTYVVSSVDRNFQRLPGFLRRPEACGMVRGDHSDRHPARFGIRPMSLVTPRRPLQSVHCLCEKVTGRNISTGSGVLRFDFGSPVAKRWHRSLRRAGHR